MNEPDRYRVFIRDMFTCQKCGKMVAQRGQIAHRIRQGVGSSDWIHAELFKAGYEKTDKWVKDHIIDHMYNTVTTCSLECNSAMDITFERVEAESLLKRIIDNVLPDRLTRSHQTAQEGPGKVLNIKSNVYTS